MSAPFARARAMMALIAAAMGNSAALAAIGPYRSRGHGRRKAFDKEHHGNKPGKYTPHQSLRERTRRLRQALKYGDKPVAWFAAQGDKYRDDLTVSPLWPLRQMIPTEAWYAFTGEKRYGPAR